MAMTFRELVLQTHRWAGLGASVVLAVVGLTGVALIWPYRLGDWARTMSRLHTRLLIGEPGEWLVITATVLSSLLILGGVYLWWKRKILSIALRRGWWRALFDFHHLFGLVGTIIMLVLSLSGIGLVLTEVELEEGQTPPPRTEAEIATRRTVHDLHTGRNYSLPMKLVYAAGSLGFLLQSATGFLMWWKPQKSRSDDDTA